MAALGHYVTAWINRRVRPQTSAIRLDRQRIFILPTAHGYAFALMLLLLFICAINYKNSMGFALTFLLATVALNGMWRCHANLLNLRVHPGRAQPVFAGQVARLQVRIDNPDSHHRYGIGLQWRDQKPYFADIFPHGDNDFILAIPTTQRGLLRPGRLKIVTRYPLGLFQAWSWVEFEQACLVYPAPRGQQQLPTLSAATSGNGAIDSGPGSEDYSGLRSYAPGDSPRHVAWKTAARGDDALLVKQFSSQAKPELWLDWLLLTDSDIEARLAQLCRWLLKAEAGGWSYGLRLPGTTIFPASGVSHRLHCLQTLALFNISVNATRADGHSKQI